MVLYTISESLLDSYGRVFQMYENAIKNIPENQWTEGKHHNLVPVVILLHSIEAADFYSSETSEFDWGHRFGVSWSESDPVEFPSKNDLMNYFKEVEHKTTEWINSSSDYVFLSEDPFPYNTGRGMLGRALYLLSHLRQHIGELNAELRQRNLPRVKWV
jgi:hypothetical protein